MGKIRLERHSVRDYLVGRKKEYESRGLECTPVIRSAFKGLFLLGWWDPAEDRVKPQFKSLQELFDEDE